MPQFMVSFFQALAHYHNFGMAGRHDCAGNHLANVVGTSARGLGAGSSQCHCAARDVVLSLPLVIFTLGLFMLVINALLLWSVGVVLKNFQVDGFASAFWGSLVISITSLLLNSLTKTKGGSSRFEFRSNRPKPHDPPDDGGGPIIDV